MKQNKKAICSVISLLMGISVALEEHSLGLGVIALMTTLTATLMVAVINETYE